MSWGSVETLNGYIANSGGQGLSLSASIYFAHVNWPDHAGDSTQDRELEIKDLVLKLIEAIKLDITVESNDYKTEVYQYFNVLSKKMLP